MAAQAEVTEVSRAEMKDAGSGADAGGFPAAAETAGEHAVPDVRRDILDSGKIALRCPRRADAAEKGAEALVIVSNDSWFQNTPAMREHYAHAILRAVESDRYVIREIGRAHV